MQNTHIYQITHQFQFVKVKEIIKMFPVIIKVVLSPSPVLNTKTMSSTVCIHNSSIELPSSYQLSDCYVKQVASLQEVERSFKDSQQVLLFRILFYITRTFSLL